MPGVFAIERSDISQQEEDIDLSVHGLCTVHIAYGNIHLINHEFELALANFEKGGVILAQADQSFPELEFFVSFGKVIAYDNLCLENETRTEIEKLLCILQACGVDINETVDSVDSCSEEYNEVTESLKNLAELVCTIEVRETLLTIINETSTQVIIFPENYYLECKHDLTNTNLGIIKQAKKIAKKIYKVCTIIIRVIELLEKLEKAITS
jgi:hypothetical protein